MLGLVHKREMKAARNGAKARQCSETGVYDWNDITVLLLFSRCSAPGEQHLLHNDVLQQK